MSDRLKFRRMQLGMSQEDVALITDISQGQVSKYERGIVTPPADILARLARTLDTSTDWLSGLSQEINEISGEKELTELEREVVHLLRTKSPEMKQKLLEIARML